MREQFDGACALGKKDALQKILGHSTIQMPERYGQLSDEAVFAEAKRLRSRSGL